MIPGTPEFEGVPVFVFKYCFTRVYKLFTCNRRKMGV